MTYKYEREKNPERPVRLDRTEGHVIIEGRTYPAKELVEALAQSGYVELRADGDSLILGRRRITPIFKSRQERAMVSLCHGSLAYCCPLTKRCAERDRALEILNLTPQEYNGLKGDAHIRFISTAKGLPENDEYKSQLYSGGRGVNQPAVDRGYGSDDYRGDFDTLDQALESSRSFGRSESGRDPWSHERPETSHMDNPNQRSENPFTDVDMSGRSISVPEGTPSSTSCRLRSDDSIEGIGSLFKQGELSPFSDDSSSDSERPSFCFSCGRTMRRGVDRCPYCGVSQ
ncbi:MAG: hypothetical protein RTU30_07860 [Candidatus Thorarchaeota archaeon]